MALFGSSGPSPEEIQQAAVIKPSLTRNLKDAVKELQRKNVISEEAIQSEDTANAVCNVLEAIFLHGLKASLSKKVTNFMTGFNEEKDFSFWEFVVFFSHRDTVSQLKRLGHITTRVGMCRAWIRLALNDGLLDSYLDSMLRDKKTMQTHYRRLAYLRDPEQPDIMKTCLQGILSFRFELSYNSSVLNMWTGTPLILAGLAESQVTPEAVLQPTTAEEAYPEVVFAAPVDGVSRSTRLITSMDLNAGLEDSRMHSNIPSQNTLNETYYDPSELSQTEIEQICELMKKEATQSSNHSEDSFGTAASQISMPDPKDMREFPQDTMSPKHINPADKFSETVLNNDSLIQSLEYGGAKVKTKSHKSKKHKSKHKKEKKKIKSIPKSDVKEDLPDTISFCSAVSDNVGSFKSLNTFYSEENTLDHIAIMKDEYDIISTDDDLTNNTQNSKENSDIVDLPAKNIDCVNDNQRQQDFSSVNENFGDFYNLSGEDEEKDNVDDIHIIVPPKKENTDPFLEKIETSGTHSHDSMTTNSTNSIRNPSQSSKIKGETLQPELSNALAVANSVEEAEDAHELEKSGQLDEDQMVLSDTVTESSVHKIDIPSNSQKQQSNSLSHSLMQGGWSSCPFDDEDDVEDVYLQNSVENEFPSLIQNGSSEKNRDNGEKENADWSISQRNYVKPVEPTENEVAALSNTVSSSKSEQDLSESIYYNGFEILPDFGETAGHLEDSKVLEFKEQISHLALEKGLDIQNFQCHGCKRSVGMFFCQPRVCAFDGFNYCYDCHENEEFYIPARIILNWDFRKHLICKDNLLLLRQFEDSPLLNAFKINQRIYDHVSILSEIKDLRQQLRYLKAYLFTCKQSVAEDFRQQVWPKEYLYDDIHMYSLLDLLQVVSGQLANLLHKVIKSASQHVYQCRLCSQKGFICEICHNPKVIYPFEMDSTKKCSSCDAVYHKSCKTDFVPCPKCRRIMERQIKMGKRATIGGSTDYVFSANQTVANPLHSDISNRQAGSS